MRTALSGAIFAVGAFALFAPSAAQQGAVQPDAAVGASGHKAAVGLPIPLRRGERIEYFKDGCGAIVSALSPAYELSVIRQKNWFGACRFGLAHGPGVIGDKYYWTDANLPIKFHYGYMQSNNWTGRFMAYGQERSEFFRSHWDKVGDVPTTALWEFTNYSRINIPWISYHLSIPRDGGYDHYSFNEVTVECRSIRPTITVELVRKLPKAQTDSFVQWCKKGDNPHSVSHELWGADVHFLYRTYERTDLDGKPTSLGQKTKEPAFQTYRCENDSRKCSDKEWAAMKGALATVLAAKLKQLDSEYSLPNSTIEAITTRFAPLEARRKELIAQMAEAAKVAEVGQ